MIPNHIQKNKFVIQLILEMIGCIAGLYNSPLSLLQNDFFFLYSLHARLNSHYKAWSYKKNKHKKITGIVKWAEPCKYVILLVSRILWHKRINPMEILIFDTHRRLSARISPFKFTQRHSSEGCLLHRKKLVT